MQNISTHSTSVRPNFPLDGGLCLCVALLMSVGLIMIASASVAYAEGLYGDSWFFAKRQIMFLLIGCVAGGLCAAIPLHIWKDYSWVMALIGFALLIVVLSPLGRSVNGSQRWVPLGLINIQASEAAKACFVIFFASYFVRCNEVLVSNLKGLVKPLGLLATVAVLLLLEPDFGSVVVIGLTVGAMLFLAGVKIQILLPLIVIALGGAALAIGSSEYRMQRLTSYLDPWAVQYEGGYQLTQSLIAFGRGEFTGVGLGNSVQKLFYLPEAHTDFIFAILAEEQGLIGAMCVLALFVFFVARIFSVAKLSYKRGEVFGGLLAQGIGVMFSCQVFVNIGVASGLLPTKGLTLPFISYGGSSLLVCSILTALLLRLSYENTQADRGETRLQKKPLNVRKSSAQQEIEEEFVEVAA